MVIRMIANGMALPGDPGHHSLTVRDQLPHHKKRRLNLFLLQNIQNLLRIFAGPVIKGQIHRRLLRHGILPLRPDAAASRQYGIRFISGLAGCGSLCLFCRGLRLSCLRLLHR
ncbi:hypothetical protein D3C81_1753180 [compost metagenome]